MRMRLPQRKVSRVGIAVERPAAPGEHHPRRARRSCSFEDAQRPQDVHVGVEHGPIDRDPHVGLGGEVEHHLGPPAGQQLDHLPRPDVDLVEGDLVGRVGTRVGKIAERPRRQVVDHVDSVPFGQQAVDEVRADEARPAGYERAHRGYPSTPAAAGTRASRRMAPASITVPSPSTQVGSNTQSGPTAAPRPTMDPRTTAPEAMQAPGRSTEPSTVAPGSSRQWAPTTLERTVDPRAMTAPSPTRLAGSTSPSSSGWPMTHTPSATDRASGAGGMARRPFNRSALAARYACGVPVSSQ